MQKLIEIAAIDITIYKFVLPLMDRLKTEPFDIIVAANESGYGRKLETCGYKVRRIDFVRNLSPIRNARAFLQVINLFKIENPDIIHVHTPIASVLSRVAAKLTLRKATVVYTLHALNKNPIFLFVEYVLCRFMTDFIFTVNRDDMKYLIKHKFIKRDRITCINSVGVNTNKFSVDKIDLDDIQVLRDSLNVKNKMVIGFVGRLVEAKGFQELVDAFIVVRKKIDCRLLIVGSSSLNERDCDTVDKVIKKVRNSGFVNDFIFVGHRDDIPEMLYLMDIFVLPSYSEGMCVSILEAMSMELPVIGTDIRGIREEITDKTGLIVPVKDSDAIAEAIEQLLTDTEKRIAMGKNGRKRVIKYFNEETAVKKQFDVFKRL